MELAKSHLDIGLFTNNREKMLAFWQGKVGLAFDHLGKLGGGVHQLRHFLGDGPAGPILKINDSRNPLPAAPPSGYRELLIAREEVSVPQTLVDPDGNRLALVPPGYCGVGGIGMRMGVRSLAAFEDFYGRILGLPKVPVADGPVFACDDSVILAFHDSDASGDAVQFAQGYRYLTVQIFDADHEYETVLQRGGSGGMAPKTLGATVRYGFIRDPDGNWIELSQRATLTGSIASSKGATGENG
ncbi:VOC family protein [Sneathiella chungangensis]|uniref:VOC family protein n=1 Tax=Sneathiella chungangensis TaxID=1418234 RepID=A0A845MCW2_9PROT|nr:VOC family protein [Sneathiella chungangensis]MZR21699.1 VOC family protein [Sneathiella chungangensis]